MIKKPAETIPAPDCAVFTSPLQLLNMLLLLSDLKQDPGSVKFIFIPSHNITSNAQVQKVVSERPTIKIIHIKTYPAKTTNTAIGRLFEVLARRRFHEEISKVIARNFLQNANIILGDYRPASFKHVASLINPRSVILIDDGSIAPQVAYFRTDPNDPRVDPHQFKRKDKLSNSTLKRFDPFQTFNPESIYFWTSYRFQNKATDFHCLHRQWAGFINPEFLKISSEIWIIGCSHVESKICTESDYLAVIKKMTCYYRGYKIIYHAHRSEREKKLGLIEREAGIKISRNETPIELYIKNLNVRPLRIATIASSVVDNLASILPGHPLIDCFIPGQSYFKKPGKQHLATIINYHRENHDRAVSIHPVDLPESAGFIDPVSTAREILYTTSSALNQPMPADSTYVAHDGHIVGSLIAIIHSVGLQFIKIKLYHVPPWCRHLQEVHLYREGLDVSGTITGIESNILCISHQADCALLKENLKILLTPANTGACHGANEEGRMLPIGLYTGQSSELSSLSDQNNPDCHFITHGLSNEPHGRTIIPALADTVPVFFNETPSRGRHGLDFHITSSPTKIFSFVVQSAGRQWLSVCVNDDPQMTRLIKIGKFKTDEFICYQNMQIEIRHIKQWACINVVTKSVFQKLSIDLCTGQEPEAIDYMGDKWMGIYFSHMGIQLINTRVGFYTKSDLDLCRPTKSQAILVQHKNACGVVISFTDVQENSMIQLTARQFFIQITAKNNPYTSIIKEGNSNFAIIPKTVNGLPIKRIYLGLFEDRFVLAHKGGIFDLQIADEVLQRQDYSLLQTPQTSGGVFLTGTHKFIIPPSSEQLSRVLNDDYLTLC